MGGILALPENENREKYIERRRIQARDTVRAGFVAGIGFNTLFLLFDAWTGLPLAQTLPLRGLWSAILLACLLATFAPRSHRAFAWLVGIGGAAGAWTMAQIMALDTIPMRHLTGLITLFIAAVGMAPTIRSASYTIAALVAIPTAVLLGAGWPLPRVLEADVFLGMAASMCALVSHLLERSQKHAFALECRLERKATTDALTGLFNRRHFFERAEAELVRRNRSGAALAVLMMDVDHFKSINDRWGHDTGDRVLAAVASELRHCAREIDVLARTGGEEFALLAVGATLAEAVEIGERMRTAVGALFISTGGHIVPVTISIGCAAVPRTDTGIDLALKHADEALYRAKHAGRDRVVAATSEGAEIGRPALEEGGHRFL